MIKKIDPQSKYLVVSTTACRAGLDKIAKSCEMIKTMINENKVLPLYLDQLIMPYAGEPIRNYVDNNNKTKIPFDKWVPLLLHVLSGIKLMHKNNLIHLDIKPYNMVYDGNVLRLIDFGLVEEIDKFNSTRGFPLYMMWPPEIYQCSAFTFRLRKRLRKRNVNGM
jgi:serine/threonine protein kinase